MDENSHKKKTRDKKKVKQKPHGRGVIFLDGNFLGGSFPEGIFPKGIFPRTKKYLFVVKCLQFFMLDNPCPFLLRN